MAPSDSYNSSSDNQHGQTIPSQGDNALLSRSGHRLSFGHNSVTSSSGGRRSFSPGRPPITGAVETQASGTYWEGRELSRRGNIHRSHLSSSIQTGKINTFKRRSNG